MRSLGLRTALTLTLGLAGASCAHQPAAPLSEASKKIVSEAASIGAISFEEDFLDARAVYQSLPVGAKERTALRSRLFGYLLAPVAKLDAKKVRADAIALNSNDDYDRVLESYRDALDLIAPEELWAKGGPDLSDGDRDQLTAAGRLVVALFAPRAHESAVALALFSLATIDAKNPTWSRRLDEVLPWVDTGAQLALSGAGPRPATTIADVLEGVAQTWPSPDVIGRLAKVYVDRQDRFAHAMRRPVGTGATRNAFNELLLEGEAIQTTALNIASVYLRCGQLEAANKALQAVANKPGDDSGLRDLVGRAARSSASTEDHLALARRFLPRQAFDGGTATDRSDLGAARGALDHSLRLFPRDIDTLLLASQVARFSEKPFLALRYADEADSAAEAARAGNDVRADIAARRLELSLIKLVERVDPERLDPATRELARLHALTDDTQKRFGGTKDLLTGADIDLEIARPFLNAGDPDRAQQLLERASKDLPDRDKKASAALQLADLAFRLGQPARAASILQQALDSELAQAPSPETVDHVGRISRLARNLGDALEAAGGRDDDARKAWAVAQRNYERLADHYVRVHARRESANAYIELGRLYYLRGRHSDGIQKFNDAIEQNESHSQSYVDALTFLVQHGEVDAALDVYRRALSKPGRTVSEYLKVYFSLWMLDLTRRAGRDPDTTAEAYLKSIATRTASLRPTRTAVWYVELARYATGKATYEQLLGRADTPGKRAELYFYEGMRRLAEGHRDDAHVFWTKVIETKMVSFIEYEMAARYLRVGAPAQAEPERLPSAETI